jgi:ribonuclease HI
MDIYTDGGCHGNPGPGGWAFIALRSPTAYETSGNEPATTNNRMELTAVIKALEYAGSLPPAETNQLRIYSDSQYVRQGITIWIHNWLRNGWKTAGKDPVKNQALWQRLHELAEGFAIDWQWVRGHSGATFNERCDALVQVAIKQLEP